MDAAVFGEPRRRMIRLPDGEMAALDFGDQDRPVDVVFLHATGFNALTYRSILAPLASTLRILAVDQRGHGASSLPADPAKLLSWKIYRDDVLALLATLDGPPPVLSGHSMGATVSLLTAGRRPEATRGLVLFDPVIMPRLMVLGTLVPFTGRRIGRRFPIAEGALRRRPSFDSVEAAFAAYKGRGAFKSWSDLQLANYVAGAFEAGPEGAGVTLACTPAWEAATFAGQAHDPWRALSRVKSPVKVFKAERNSTCNATADQLRRTNRRVDVLTVPGTSHFIPMERPDLMREALLDVAI
ncbi:MAG: alpha/beta hydrolase [Pseudomonadota bacterium]|nr:alpha/beta hydrolase [Pseudomonadota bacterium]